MLPLFLNSGCCEELVKVILFDCFGDMIGDRLNSIFLKPPTSIDALFDYLTVEFLQTQMSQNYSGT